MIAATFLIASALAVLPGRNAIPPLLESDYCYLLAAANRLVAGAGLTATPPVAPFQSWEWRADWAFVTQWPVGYSLLVAALRRMTGITTVQATSFIAILACAAAFVGWFTWVWRASPRGLTRALLAAVASGSAVSAGSLINPSTDALITATLPWILLLLWPVPDPHQTGANARQIWITMLAGLLSGLLFWFRYASLFIPAAITGWLLLAFLAGRVRPRELAGFILAASLPILAVVGINWSFSAEPDPQAQLNLGRSVGFDFSWALVVEAWRQFTSFDFYAHRAFRHVFTLGPLVLIGAATATPAGRGYVRALASSPPVIAGCMLVVMLMILLIAASTFFSAKFNFVGLDRYYQPLKPLYFVLFVMPLMLIPRRAVRAGLCCVLLAMCWWTVQRDWRRTLDRWQAAGRPATPSGYWSRSFEPNANQLYAWLRARADDRLVVVSNFHEYIAFETGIPALPIPPDRDALDRWVAKATLMRGVSNPRVLFVLDPDNRWRGHWIPPKATIVERFRLEPYPAELPDCGAEVLEYKPNLSSASAVSSKDAAILE
jgi:hypothetical protein